MIRVFNPLIDWTIGIEINELDEFGNNKPKLSPWNILEP